MGIPDHFTCLVRNLYANQETAVRTGNETTDWFKIEKGVHQGRCYPSAYLTYIQSTSCKMLSWMNQKLELRFPEEISEPDSNCQHPLDHRKSKRVPEKHLFLLY